MGAARRAVARARFCGGPRRFVSGGTGRVGAAESGHGGADGAVNRQRRRSFHSPVRSSGGHGACRSGQGSGRRLSIPARCRKPREHRASGVLSAGVRERRLARTDKEARGGSGRAILIEAVTGNDRRELEANGGGGEAGHGCVGPVMRQRNQSTCTRRKSTPSHGSPGVTAAQSANTVGPWGWTPQRAAAGGGGGGAAG